VLLNIKANLASVVVPSIWPLEVANVVQRAESKGLLRPADTDEFLELLRGLPIEVDAETATHALSQILTLARRHQLTSYDAAYLELAARRGIAIATLDDHLRRAAADARIAIV
jgi:predicted nucleic acid-binding protein